MNRAVVFGAGAIGLGLLGRMLSRSNYIITFIDIDKELMSIISRKKEYRYNIVGPFPETVTVKCVEGIHFSDHKAILDSVVHSDLIFTAAGGSALHAISPILAKGLMFRLKEWEPLDIICCENLWDTAAFLKSQTLDSLEKLSLQEKNQRVISEETKFTNTIISKMCKKISIQNSILPPITDFTSVVIEVEKEGKLIINRDTLVKTRIDLRNAQFLSSVRFKAEKDKKTFAHNGGHALLAYLGKLKGYNYLYEAGTDKGIKKVFDKAIVKEVGEALIRKYHEFSIDQYKKYVNEIYSRMTSTYLNDTIERGIRSSIEKIRGPDARLTRAAKFIIEQGGAPNYFCFTIAAALIMNRIDMGKPVKTVCEYCDLELSKDGELVNLIIHAYNIIRNWKTLNYPDNNHN